MECRKRYVGKVLGTIIFLELGDRNVSSLATCYVQYYLPRCYSITYSMKLYESTPTSQSLKPCIVRFNGLEIAIKVTANARIPGDGTVLYCRQHIPKAFIPKRHSFTRPETYQKHWLNYDLR